MVLSFLSGASQRTLIRQFTTYTRLINAIGGVMLIAIGFYDLGNNWELIATFAA